MRYSFVQVSLCLCMCTGSIAAASAGVLPVHDPWVDSVYHSLSVRERVAQLFMVAAYSNRDSVHTRGLLQQVNDLQVGGVIFFQGDPISQALLTNRLQIAAPVPLLVGMDAEWGLIMRLDTTMRFPYHMTLGAVEEPHLIYETGRAIGRHCSRLGVHVNFAPVADINSNADNPVINFRSFGSDRYGVSWHVHEFARGMLDAGVIPVVKHFPGHGDTEVDSHHALPVVRHGRQRLDSLELYPFRFAVEAGIPAVMSAHLSVPALDISGAPASLSREMIEGLLRSEMGFDGLVFTDALNMEGVKGFAPPGQVEVQALEAGNDVLLFSEDPEEGIDAIVKAIRAGRLSEAALERHCRRVLAAKRMAGLDQRVQIDTTGLLSDLHTAADRYLNVQLAEHAVTLLRNNDSILPIEGRLDRLRLASISLGSTGTTAFQRGLDRYTEMDRFAVPLEASMERFDALVRKLHDYDRVILGIHGLKVYPGSHYGVPERARRFIAAVAGLDRSVVVLFGNPYFIGSVEGMERAAALLVTYQETDLLQNVASQVIFGAMGARGNLPVRSGSAFNCGKGLNTKGGIRLGYTMPEAAGIPSTGMQRIDSIASAAVQRGATPGCVALVAVKGNVIYHKAFGYHTYDSIVPVQRHHLYDLASITKIAGALPALMKLYGEQKVRLDAPVERYMPYFKNSDAGSLTIREVLAHQSGLLPWIPFWKATIRGNARYPWKKRWDGRIENNGRYKWATFKKDSSRRFPVRVTDDLWLHRKYRKKIFRSIKKSPVGEKQYQYSGLMFYVFPRMIEQITGQDYLEYLNEHFYDPLGAWDLGYHPLQRRSISEIVPTEYDAHFRKVQIRGDVHDEGAAMMHYRSSNAGLFSTANDLAKLMQMYLNNGHYGGERYLRHAALREFRSCQYCDEGNERGLGFDRQRHNGNTARDASEASFGHSGFTGTYAWADPEYGLLYIFLSNRVYPSRRNTMLLKMNVRTDILQSVYDLLSTR